MVFLTRTAPQEFHQMLRDNRCMYMAHACFYVCCSDCVGVCEIVCCISAIVQDSGLLYVCVRGVMDVIFFCLYCHAWSCRCLCMGSMSVS